MPLEPRTKAEAIFEDALGRSLAERSEFARAKCGTNKRLWAEVEELLALDVEARSFLSVPIFEAIPALPEVQECLPGRQLGRYEIVRKISHGGMATVYLARDEQVGGKLVVIKLLDRAHSPKVLQAAFEAELKALNLVSHQAVVGVSDVGTLENKTPFLVLEYIPGVTLRAALQDGPFPLARVRLVIRQIGQALAAAHKLGVWHLDLKPENIILSDAQSSDERVSVIDFGIARLKDDSVYESIAGSDRYMAPEQRLGQISAQSDIYALGLVAFELIVGRLPIDINDLPRELRSTSRQLPAAAIKAIQKATQAAAENRFSSIEEFTSRFTEGPPARTTLSWLVLVLLVILVTVVFMLNRSKKNAAIAQPMRSVPFTTTPGLEGRPSLSPDGKWVFYVGGEASDRAIFRKPVSGGPATRIVHEPGKHDNPQCSPDGQTIAFFRSTSAADVKLLLLKNADGTGEEQEVARGAFGSLAWAPSGKHLVVSVGPSTPNLRIFSLEMGTWKDLSPPRESGADVEPAFAPNGSKLAFIRHHFQGSSDLFVSMIDKTLHTSGPPQRVTFDGKYLDHVQWTPDSAELIYSSGRDLRRVASDGSSSSRLIPELTNVGQLAIAQQAWVLVYSADLRDSNIWKLNIEAGGNASNGETLVIGGTYNDGDMELSPDARHLAFVSKRSGKEQVWVAQADGSWPHQITSFDAGDRISAVWAPDSAHLFVNVRSHKLGERVLLYSLASGEVKSLLEHGDAISVSRDGRSLYYGRSGQNGIWRMDLVTNRAEQVTTAAASQPVESIDGKTLYYSDRVSGGSIWQQSTVDGSVSRVVERLYRRGQFAVGKSGIFYIATPPKEKRQILYLKRFRDGTVQPLHTFQKDLGWGVAISKDERAFFFSQYDVNNSDLMVVAPFR